MPFVQHIFVFCAVVFPGECCHLALRRHEKNFFSGCNPIKGTVSQSSKMENRDDLREDGETCPRLSRLQALEPVRVRELEVQREGLQQVDGSPR